MPITHFKLRELFSQFLAERGHKETPAISLVPKDDPTTLFTGSGMQQFVPYLLGEVHPLGTRLYNIQRCVRAQDIEEVGDNRHDSFFEMMGNWSLGDYFKKEQLSWFFLFLTDKLGIKPEKLYVTVFRGEGKLPKDGDAIEIWKEVFKSVGIDARVGERIFEYDAKKNWWSRAGIPDNMPAGEPGGPDSEVFYEFTQIPHNTRFGEKCHPNCDCGRFLEIGNSVFMQYKKMPDGTFQNLPKQNVDFGGGLERFIMAVENNPDMFATSLYLPIIKEIEKITRQSYEKEEDKPAMRIISDHLKASVFLIKDGVLPTNKEQGYVLRRLLRRLTVKLRTLLGTLPSAVDVAAISKIILKMYEGIYFNVVNDSPLVKKTIEEEIKRFSQSLEKGLKEIQKLETVSGKDAFNLYQSFGFPLEVTEELLREKGKLVDKKQFYDEFQKHRELSRSQSAGKFKGGLADNSQQVFKYHTATHLLHQALFDVLGSDIRQEGSNITGERLRFDYYSTHKPDESQIRQIEQIVNEKIKEELPIEFKIMPKNEAEKLGAKSFFREKYPDMVKVYFIGNYSKEFCGGPHVQNTAKIGSITIFKTEKIGSNMYRIYAK
jgi:alanyl-tRNA synthetase